MTSPAPAQEGTSYEARWEQATKQPGAEVSEFADFKMVRCCGGLTFYYFTKPSHPAHPGVIKRQWVKEDGGIVSHVSGWSYAPDAAQPAFKAWMQQINDLDEKARVAMTGPSKEAIDLVAADTALGYASRCTALATSMNEIVAQQKSRGGLRPADARYVEPFAKLEEAAAADLTKQIANLGSKSPTSADLIGAGKVFITKAAGGSAQVAQDCWSHYEIRVAAGS